MIMTIHSSTSPTPQNLTRKYFQTAFFLALFTILYNVAEGLFSIFTGIDSECLVLMGFGVDSFIEVISGIGIIYMIQRIRNTDAAERSQAEKTALRITGYAFYMLVAALVLSSLYNLYMQHQPQTTFWGLIIAVISIVVMSILVWWKKKTGRKLNSAPIIADANCTLVCVYMSIILLLSSALYELFHLSYIDSIGTLGLAYFAFKEGRECFEKVRNNDTCCC